MTREDFLMNIINKHMSESEETMSENTYKITIYYENDNLCSVHNNVTEFYFTDGSKFFYICDSKGNCEYISSKKILNIIIDQEK